MNKTLLIVEDNPDNLFSICKHLEKQYNLVTSLNAIKAFEIAHHQHIDLILADWKMPDISGIELLLRLKQSIITCGIPVLLITGTYTESNDLKSAFDAGAADYLRKPIQEPELLARVGSALKLVDSIRIIETQKEEIIEQNKLLQEQKNRELSSKALEVFQKNQALAEMKELLEQLLPKANEAQKAMIKQAMAKLKNSLNDAQNWTSFRLYFEKVHPSFFTSLQGRFPMLTLDDLKICAFMKIHMSSREIANIINISQESVRTHKYRLKKKLGLGADTDLQEFITTVRDM